MGILKFLRERFSTKFNHYGEAPTWYDVNERPDSMTNNDVAFFKDRYNIIFFDAKKRNGDSIGFKSDK